MYTSQYVNDVHAVMYTFMLIIIIIYINVIDNTIKSIIVILPLSPSLINHSGSLVQWGPRKIIGKFVVHSSQGPVKCFRALLALDNKHISTKVTRVATLPHEISHMYTHVFCYNYYYYIIHYLKYYIMYCFIFVTTDWPDLYKLMPMKYIF